MDIKPEDMREIFASWSREILLEEYVQRSQDFVPLALEVLHAELRDRGVSDEEIEAARERYRQELIDHPLAAEDNAVVLETFDDRIYAEAAASLLEQADIPHLLHGSDQLLFGPGLLRFGPDPITLKVAAHDEARARAVLAELPPQEALDESEPSEEDDEQA